MSATRGTTLLVLVLQTLLGVRCFFWEGVSAETNVFATTRTGEVRGFQDDVFGQKVNCFLGIPFAEPPLGKLRFRAPKPAGPWEGVFDATRLPNTCFQIRDTTFKNFRGSEMWNANTEISEDCLYLNVWTPAAPTGGAARSSNGGTSSSQDDDATSGRKKPLAVLVWIYGGSYSSGSSTLTIYDGRTLAASHDVVVVSMQYRLGPLGFLYGGNEDAPGNQGLMDQNLALQWVRDNIASFGGDPGRVTLWGESAGAASVSYHLLSKKSQPLFERAVLESASALAPWAWEPPNKAFSQTMNLAAKVDCLPEEGVPEINGVLDCLRQLSPDLLTLKQWDIVLNVIGTAFPPTTDQLGFVTKDPRALVASGDFKKTDLLLGSNLHEGTFFMLYGRMDVFPFANETGVTQERFVDAMGTFVPETSVDKVAFAAIDFEYNGVDRALDPSLDLTRITSDATGDYWFICPVNDFAQAYADDGRNVYMYRFLHRTRSNPWPSWMGVIHGYEIDYFFGDAQNGSLPYDEDERKLSRKMMKYLVNFAKRGRPASEEVWPAYSPVKREYKIFDVSDGDAGIGKAPRFRHCALWSQLLPKLKKLTDYRLCTSTATDLSSINAFKMIFIGIYFVFYLISHLW